MTESETSYLETYILDTEPYRSPNLLLKHRGGTKTTINYFCRIRNIMTASEQEVNVK